jgi:hypothetical protein
MASKEVIECEFCQKHFSTKSNLSLHKRTAKFCLEKQGKKNTTNKCEFCKEVFSHKQRLLTHNEICKARIEITFQRNIAEKDKLIEEMRQRNKELEEQIFKLAEKAIEKPTHTTNNTTNNYIDKMLNITPEFLTEQSANLSVEHVKKGAIGYSNFFLEHSLKDRVACIDYSRRKIKYKNQDGEVVTDPDMSNLSMLLFNSIKEKNQELTIKYIDELHKLMTDHPNDSQYFMGLVNKFGSQDVAFAKMLEGDKNGLYHDIIRNICSKTLV